MSSGRIEAAGIALVLVGAALLTWAASLIYVVIGIMLAGSFCIGFGVVLAVVANRGSEPK